MSTFLQLAHALRDESAAARAALLRLAPADNVAVSIEVERLRSRIAELEEAAQRFDELVPHERVVLKMIEVGTIERLPSTFSVDTSNLRAGKKVLLKATVLEAYPREGSAKCVVETVDQAMVGTIARGEIAGVERPQPTMFGEATISPR